MNQILEPSKLPILQFFAIFPRCLHRPLPEYNFPQNEFIIFRIFNIYVSSAANLVLMERVLSEKLRIWLCLFFLFVKMADRRHNKTSIVFLIISNGNRTEWSPIRSVIIRVITKSDVRAAGVRFVYHDYPITN